MTTEEKIQHFYKVSVDSAREEAREELEAYRAEQEALLVKYKEEIHHHVQLERKQETERIRKQMNREFSNEQLRIKRLVSRKQTELKHRLFTEVEDKLSAFRKSKDYPEYLCRKLRDAILFAGEDEIHLIISADDRNLADEIAKNIGCPVEISGEDFGGGIKAVIPSRNILMDESFDTLLENERASYSMEEHGFGIHISEGRMAT